MTSYWFVEYTTKYIDLNGKLKIITGNAVLAIENESFLPGTAIYIIRKSMSESIKDDSGKLIMDIKFGVVLEISVDGYRNFDSPDLDKINVSYKTNHRIFWNDDVRVDVI
jgi:hypothetical protein